MILNLFIDVSVKYEEYLMEQLSTVLGVNGVYNATHSVSNIDMPATLEEIECKMENK